MATFRCAGLEPVEADSAHQAARIFAERVATQLYGQSGMATYIVEAKPGVFRAFIGAYERNGRTVGETIILTLTEQRQ